jgi:1-acyl-sn-glycerol-3-phosphate acyltransferase
MLPGWPNGKPGRTLCFTFYSINGALFRLIGAWWIGKHSGSVEALKQGKILAVAPEGTRSKDGRLLTGKPGIVALSAAQ